MELPLIAQCERPGTDTLILSLDIQPTLRCFIGHFPEAPVVAGVVQIDWVMALAARYFQRQFVFCGMQSIKFLKLMRPPLAVTLTIEAIPLRGLLKFSYRDQQQAYSSGGIQVEPWEHDK